MARGGAHKKDESVAVAIDKDKFSQQALKWTIERLLSRGQVLTLLHVKHKPSHSTTNVGTYSDSDDAVAHKQQVDNQAHQFFLPFRCFCTRSNIPCNEVTLEEGDISKALINYVNKNVIDVLVLGAPSRTGIVKRFKSDIPSIVSKGAPDFCTVYTIGNKGKVSSMRQATSPAPAKPISTSHNQPHPATRPQLLHQLTNASEVSVEHPIILRSQPSRHLETQDSVASNPPSRTIHEDFEIKSPFNRPGSRASMGKGQDTSMADSDISFVSSGRQSLDRGNPPAWNSGTVDSYRLSNGSETSSPGSASPSPMLGMGGMRSIDSNNNSSYSNPYSHEMSSASESETSWASQSHAQEDVEAEMRRLKLELKQTMDMYSTACKEALNAKQKVSIISKITNLFSMIYNHDSTIEFQLIWQASELHRWKMEEEHRLEEAKMAEGAALAIAEKEKMKCKAALQAAEVAQRSAVHEARKRANVEKLAVMEAEETKKALEGFGHGDIGYRRYSIQEIETATNGFSAALKIGEGGYGPVYRGELDHTQVAIKVLRPDAAQGRSQFQREVEVLSCIRHPNMVLLLGACPENGCLVYEFMANGSLEDCLFRKPEDPVLPWQLRFRIAEEIATGLLFLHQTRPEPIVHRDLKPGNILLDRNYVSKISDVGLARLVPPSVANSVTQYRMTATAGTFFYIDPEYQQTGLLGIKSDVYSLGVMLLQIITAKPPIGLAHNVERAIEKGKFAEMLDPDVKDWPVEEALKFAKLSIQCAEMRKRDRPDLGKVVLPELSRLRAMAEESMGFQPYSICDSPCMSQASFSQERFSLHHGLDESESSYCQSGSSTSSYSDRRSWLN
ncbi:U-box domain-containing protein 52-like [Cucurbita pepo subsp. pepo]|uniref:U-box domain-containing protein 52-like n=1 Tax=Cucurbita pepo subsp. pepo TaxID=3664 RepID=UPI000C9D95D9|nr:U-box domain-containing protein 52-like [Cucurbita pepo subsp. pepo]